jgi:hypothetical protein
LSRWPLIASSANTTASKQPPQQESSDSSTKSADDIMYDLWHPLAINGVRNYGSGDTQPTTQSNDVSTLFDLVVTTKFDCVTSHRRCFMHRHRWQRSTTTTSGDDGRWLPRDATFESLGFNPTVRTHMLSFCSDMISNHSSAKNALDIKNHTNRNESVCRRSVRRRRRKRAPSIRASRCASHRCLPTLYATSIVTSIAIVCSDLRLSFSIFFLRAIELTLFVISYCLCSHRRRGGRTRCWPMSSTPPPPRRPRLRAQPVPSIVVVVVVRIVLCNISPILFDSCVATAASSSAGIVCSS